MDFVEHDLKSLMETMRKKKQVFLAGEVKCLMIQLLSAISHLHDNWILHRDLKSSNLLLSHNGILKVNTQNLEGLKAGLRKTPFYEKPYIYINIFIGWRFWTCSGIWLATTSLHLNCCYLMVSCTRTFTRNQRILNSN